MPHVIQSFLLDGRGRFATAARRTDVPVAGAPNGGADETMVAQRLRLDGRSVVGISHWSLGRSTATGRSFHPSIDTDTAQRACERLGKER